MRSGIVFILFVFSILSCFILPSCGDSYTETKECVPPVQVEEKPVVEEELIPGDPKRELRMDRFPRIPRDGERTTQPTKVGGER
jgi:hypothetical protein